MINDTPDGDTEDPSLSKALKNLAEDEVRLENAEAEVADTRRDIAADIKEIEEAERDRVEVHVEYINDVEKVDFKVSINATLQHVWDKSYEKLHVEKKPKDIFQTGGKKPKSLMANLNLTLKEARDQGVIEDYKFGIVSESGGA
jgi:hypothetical protein